MKSINFEFLRFYFPQLPVLGAFAEQYVYTDPAGAVAKLRIFGEEVTQILYAKKTLPKPYNAGQKDLIESSAFQAAVPLVIRTKLDALRYHGNKGAHGDKVTAEQALQLLHESFDLGQWLMLNFTSISTKDFKSFVPPPQDGLPDLAKVKLTKEKQELQKKLDEQEAQLAQLLAELEAERAKAAQIEQTAEQLAEQLQQGQAAADVLGFDEATTRTQLIDAMILSAGWDIQVGKDSEQVKREVQIGDQPTPSGEGKADYVLFGDNGKPLAVIEVKRTAKDPTSGMTQARFYADGLETKFGQRPVIFYTNGLETYIWDDAQKFPPRQVFGFYSKDSLEYLLFQRVNHLPATSIEPSLEIAGRLYQLEAIKRVAERFDDRHRKTLLVQATGTGKTRVAISLVDVMLRANQSKRVLFLCDRLELRKQAMGAFKTFLPGASRVMVTPETAKERNHQIYFATYPSMMGCFETFDVGFFDLIIADESHRSIYNKYRDLFLYFDALQIGLTATPVQLIDRNTFSLFLCEDGMPTVNYELKTAVDEGFLVPPRVESFTTEFQRDGIKWDDLSPDQQKQLEEQLDDAEHAAYESKDLDRLIFNKDTNRVILRNLMEQGRHHPDGTLGKTILFARNHAHAKLLKELFDKAWPAFGGGFCQVIDHYNPKAEQLIDDFKGQGRNNDIVLAISVDMLDTGIDVPEIVNLVFAKPVGSYVKFWQMIGRGTRLCPDLFGPGKDKKDFLIIDHWGNFDHFGVDFKQPAGSIPKSLLQRVFEARLELAATSRAAGNEASLQAACELLGHDLAALEETKALEVREHAVELRRVSSDEALHKLDPITKATLEQEIAPLMRWRPVYGQEPAYRFDKLVALLQREVVTPSGRFDDLKGELINQVNGLQTNLSQVKAKDETIKLVRSEEFWKEPSVAKLESVRGELRSIMQFRQGPHTPRPGPVVVDVAEESGEFQLRKKKFPLDGLELVAYRKRVEEVFEELFDESPALQKIKAGEPVTEAELAELIDDVLRLDASLDLDQLRLIFPKTKGHLDRAIRRIIGLDAKQVEARFADFVQSHTALTSQQVHFLRLLQSHIAHYGAVELEQLYEAPFTTIHNEGVDGVFTDKAQVDDLLSIISTFETPQEETSQ